MWSKTKQALESRLAEGLKGRVSYHYDVYRTKKCKEKQECPTTRNKNNRKEWEKQ